jgi:hypothetical protein
MTETRQKPSVRRAYTLRYADAGEYRDLRSLAGLRGAECDEPWRH